MARRIPPDALAKRETKEEWWARREAFFKQLDRDELIHALLMVQWREQQRFRGRRGVPRRVMEAARALVEFQESQIAQQLTDAVADLSELTVRRVSRQARNLFRNVALAVGQFGLGTNEEMMLVGMILQRDDDDGDREEETEPDKPRTPATVE